MASTDAIPVPRKNAAFRFSFAIRKPSDSTLITTWAGMDSEVSLDGASFSDCTNEATEIGTSGCGYIDLTSSEMNADCVILKVTVTNTGAVPLVFTFYPESVGDYRCDTVQIAGSTTAASQLAKSAGVILSGTVSNAVASPTVTVFSAADITEATADHYNGRVIVFTSGALIGQSTAIVDFARVSSEGQFTVVALTEAAANGDTFIIV